VEGRPKTVAVLGIVDNWGAELAADFARAYGLDLAVCVADVVAGRRSPLWLEALIGQLPPGSAYRRDRPGDWTVDQQLLNTLIGVLSALRSDYVAAHSRKSSRRLKPLDVLGQIDRKRHEERTPGRLKRMWQRMGGVAAPLTDPDDGEV
jgi:hypothetical protein